MKVPQMALITKTSLATECAWATLVENHCRNEKRATDNLKLHRLSLQLNGANLEVDSNGTDVTLCVCVVCEPQKEAGLEQEVVKT